ncbi:roundabout homolog 1-like [Portunus trituberculatus]|uniref:roundabout homolog 1-like n=1 Tax=Portunus trituberculatus TaxID=210409 RepID=UPI001E1D1F83|nr:roundabout homolog 1-like [Portunus trituberculatus]
MIRLLCNVLLLAGVASAHSQQDLLDRYVYEQHVAEEQSQDEEGHVSSETLLPSFTAASQHFSVEVGGDITFPCQMKNQGSHVLMFKHALPNGEHRMLFVGNMALKPSKRLIKSGNSFTLRGVRRSHAGKYVCRIETSPAKELIHTLDVQYPATVRRVSPAVQQVVQGSGVTLECQADGNPPAAISWSRQQGHLPSGAQAVEGLSLTLEGVDRHVEGTYVCTASNGVGQPSATTMAIEVQYPPDIITEEAILHTGEGDEASLTCVVHGRPTPTITWTKEDNPLILDSHVSYQHNLHRHTLTIFTVRQDDFGDYSCTAKNALGSIKKTLRLTGVPKVPRITSSSAGADLTSYTIVWRTESHTPIVMYRLQYRIYMGYPHDLSGNQWSVSLHSAQAAGRESAGPEQYMSHTLQGLQPSTDYELTVAVENKFGWSARSEVFRFYTRKDTGMGEAAGNSIALSAPRLTVFLLAVFLSLTASCL